MPILTPHDLGLILTYRCHGGCRHCLYNCGPRWPQEPITRQELTAMLEAVTRWPSPPQVHFTGGEPMLHFPLLLEGVRMAVQRGLSCYLETSASWCIDEEQAEARFRALREAGLEAVLISCSPFHAERIPPIRTMRAVHAAFKTFGPGRTMVYISEFLDLMRRFGVERPTPLSRYEETFGLEEARRILWGGYGILSGGRAGYRLGHLAPHHPAQAFRDETCAAELLYAQHSHLDLHGNYIPAFCGGLTLGDWHDLPGLLARYQAGDYPPLVEVLIQRGPYGLLELARKAHAYQPLPEGYTGKCHLCVDVRRHLVAHGTFEELRPQEFYDHV